MSDVRRGEEWTSATTVSDQAAPRPRGSPLLARFEQEAQILARLQYRNVVAVLDTGIDGDTDSSSWSSSRDPRAERYPTRRVGSLRSEW
jgi:hypothetical protein